MGSLLAILTYPKIRISFLTFLSVLHRHITLLSPPLLVYTAIPYSFSYIFRAISMYLLIIIYYFNNP